MSGRTPHTRVDFIDDKPYDVGHITRAIHINGSPVCIEQDSIELDYSPNGPTKVTVTLIVDEIHFTKADGVDNAEATGAGASTGPHLHVDIGGIATSAIEEALRRGEFHNVSRP